MAQSEPRRDPPFRADPSDELPVGVQLEWRLRALIASGRLAPGERMPSVRRWRRAGVNVNTVRAVYARLEEGGLIVTRHGPADSTSPRTPAGRPRSSGSPPRRYESARRRGRSARCGQHHHPRLRRPAGGTRGGLPEAPAARGPESSTSARSRRSSSWTTPGSRPTRGPRDGSCAGRSARRRSWRAQPRARPAASSRRARASRGWPEIAELSTTRATRCSPSSPPRAPRRSGRARRERRARGPRRDARRPRRPPLGRVVTSADTGETDAPPGR